MELIDLRSDTVTQPTKDMRNAMYQAEVGDDVYEEDPTILKLEKLAADIIGKEAALFVPSGTQGNQVAILTHCKQGEEVILEEHSHIFSYEGATMSAFAGVQPHTIRGEHGVMDPEDVRASIRDVDIHFPETGLICLENTHNRAGGSVIPIDNMRHIYTIAQNENVPVHLDGARIFNASIASGIDVKTFAKYTDSIQFCLSKGLGAPVGSIIASTYEFIERARKWRKRLGGGMRQAGIIAAPGIVALETMIDRLEEDHAHANLLAKELQNIKRLSVENEVETNIVLLNTKELDLTANEFLQMLKQHNVLATSFGPFTVRFVTHYGVSREDIISTVKIIHDILHFQV